MSFAEQRLDDNLIIYATVGGPRWNTTVDATQAGYETRNANWSYPMGKWELGDRLIQQADLDVLTGFFNARRGKWQAFRFKDFADFECASGEGVVMPVPGQTGKWQMFKLYGGTQLRKIIKPVLGTVSLELADPELEATVDYTTGIITASIRPMGWTGEFDVPARFDTDELKRRFDHFNKNDRSERIFYVFGLPVIEVPA